MKHKERLRLSTLHSFQLFNTTRRILVAPMRARLMDLFKTEMAEADYHNQRNVAADPSLYGGILSSGWCEKKV